MAWVYILRGSSGRHYIGSTVDLDARFTQHSRGHTATTTRLGGKLQIVAKKDMNPLFLYPDLSYPAHFVVVENARAEGLEFGEFLRDIVMLEPVFHKKQIAQGAGIRLQRIEKDRAVRRAHRQQPARFVRTRKIFQM